MPFSLANAGSETILRYSENGVKEVTAEPLPGQQKYYLKAVTEAQARALYPEAVERGTEENAKAERYQLAEEADREARKDPQRQASRTIACTVVLARINRILLSCGFGRRMTEKAR